MAISSLSRLQINARLNNRVRRHFSSSTPASQAIIELREYELFPEHAANYMKETTESSSDLVSLAPLRFFSLPETGGKLHVATHGYYYAGGLAERDKVRRSMEENSEWQTYIEKTKSSVQSQKSTLFVEAPLVRQMDLPGLANAPEIQMLGDDCILELRRYKLKLGYDTVPRFLELYNSGLPSKLNAEGTDPTTSLISLLYCEVGRLNEVIEIWRHGEGTAAMEQSRAAARGANEWRSAIASIADLALEFNNTIHKPVSFSPIK
jgi:hypothetical protein